MSDPTPNQPIPPQQPAANAQPIDPASPAPKPRKRRRRWWLRILIALPVLLIILILLAPTIASLAFVRALVLPMVASSVAPNGKLDVKGWTFAWFGGQRIDGVTLLDDQGAAVAHLNVKTDASLWSVIRGKYAVGDTTVDGDFDVRIDPVTGRVNALHVMGLDAPAKTKSPTSSKPDSSKSADGKLPIDLNSVSGTLTLNLNGTVSSTDLADKTIPFTKLEHGKFVVDLNHLEQGTKLDGDLAFNIGGKPAAITINATADVIENNKVITDPNKIAANLVASVQQLDLSVANAFLAAQHADVGGVMKGKLIINLTPGAAAVVKSDDNLGIDGFTLTAPQLKGDTFKSQRVDLPISITRSADANPTITIESAGLKTDVATVSITGSLPQSIIQNLQAKHAPGAAGQLKVTTDVPDFAKVVAMLPNTAKLQPGVTIDKGYLHDELTLAIKPDGANVTQALSLDASGTANGKPIKLQKPITLDASGDVALRDGLATTLADVLGFKLDFGSSFATVTGGGVPAKADITGNADLGKLRSEVAQFVDLGDLAMAGTADFLVNTNGDPTDNTKPLSLVAHATLTGATISKAGTTYLSNEQITTDLDGVVTRTPEKQVVTFNTLAVHSDSGLFDVQTVGAKPWFAMFANGNMGGVGQLKIGAALDRLVAPLPFMKTIDPAMRLTRGRLDTTFTAALDDATKRCTIDVDATVQRLTVGKALNEETIHFVTKATLPADFGSDATKTAAPLAVTIDNYELTSSFANLHGKADLLLKDPAKPTLSPFEMARGATFQGAVPSLPKLYALVNGFGMIKPAPTVDASGKPGTPLPPLSVDGGALSFDGSLTRDDAKQLTSLTLTVPGISDLALSRGEATFKQADPITLSLAANVTTDTSKATVSEQLQHIVVSQLQAKMPGLASVVMKEPIDVTFTDDRKPIAKGHLTGDANLDKAGALLAVVNGKNPLPYKGNATFDQTIASDKTGMKVSGNAALTNLAPVDPKAAALPEKLRKLNIDNDVSADAAFTTLTINNVALVAPDAKDVFSATVVGTIKQLMTQNNLDGVKATATYDLAQLWPLVQPIVDPTGTTLGKVQDIKGKYDKTFLISGSYPMVDASGNPLLFNQSIKALVVSGDLQLDRFNVAEKGVDLSNLTLPLSVKNGIATIAYADGKSGGGFDVNEGKGNLGGLSVDLTGDEPVLGNVKNQKLVTGAKINPVVANSLGKFISPMFPNATTATGSLDLTLSSNGLRLGKSLMTDKSGAATILMSITDMEIGNPLSENLVGGLINKIAGGIGGSGIDTSGMNNFVGEIKNATINFDRGVVHEDLTFMIGEGPGKTATADASDDQNAKDQSNAIAPLASKAKAKPKDQSQQPAAVAKAPTLYPFSFTGDIRAVDLNMNLSAGFPLQLLQDKIKGKDFASIAQYLPPQLKLGFSGTTTNAKFALDPNFAKSLADAFIKQQADRLINGKDKNDGKNGAADNGSGKKSDADKVGDIIGGILGGSQKNNGNDGANGTNDQTTGGNNADNSDDAKKKSNAQKRRDAEEAQRQQDAADKKKRDDGKRK